MLRQTDAYIVYYYALNSLLSLHLIHIIGVLGAKAV
jgi:hypothetical protein